jgi:periplasmic protein TonB
MKTTSIIPLLLYSWVAFGQLQPVASANDNLAILTSEKSFSNKNIGEEEDEKDKKKKKTAAIETSKMTESTFDASVVIPDDSILVAPQAVAEFAGGQDALKRFFARNLVIPEKYKKQRMSVRVFVRFVVEKTGQITRAHLVKGSHDELNIEALRVVRMMPPWNPATHYNRTVQSYQTIPVAFLVE